MKKILALTAAAALFAGCDFAGGADGTAVAFSNVTVSDLTITPDVAPVIEIQDMSGRAYFSSDVTTGAALGGFEIVQPSRDLFVVILDRDAPNLYSFVGVSDAFRADQLTGDVTLEIRTQAGVVIGHAALDMP